MAYNIDAFYTHSEKTVRKYTVYQAIQSALARLNGRKPLCTNAVSGRQNSEKITLKELNDLADRMVDDSYYYAS